MKWVWAGKCAACRTWKPAAGGQRVGFDTAIVPKHNLNMLDAAQFPGLRLVGAAYLREAINAIKINK